MTHAQAGDITNFPLGPAHSGIKDVCGSVLTVANADKNYAPLTSAGFFIGDVAPATAVAYSSTWPYPPYSQPATTNITYTAQDPRVTALQARVDVLEKMLAALLSGRDTEMTRPKRRRKGGGQ